MPLEVFDDATKSRRRHSAATASRSTGALIPGSCASGGAPATARHASTYALTTRRSLVTAFLTTEDAEDAEATQRRKAPAIPSSFQSIHLPWDLIRRHRRPRAFLCETFAITASSASKVERHRTTSRWRSYYSDCLGLACGQSDFGKKRPTGRSILRSSCARHICRRTE